MSVILIISVCVVSVTVLLAALILSLRFKPELAAPVTSWLMKRRRVRESVTGKVSRELAENPEAYDEALQSQLGRDGARQLHKLMKGKSEKEIQGIMSTVFDKQENGEQVTVADLQGKPKTADQVRHKTKKKQNARRKRKNAKKQKKRNRR